MTDGEKMMVEAGFRRIWKMDNGDECWWYPEMSSQHVKFVKRNKSVEIKNRRESQYKAMQLAAIMVRLQEVIESED